jgi:hypothetical protein
MIRPPLGQLDFTMASATTKLVFNCDSNHPPEACHIFNAWLGGRNDHELLPRLCFAKTTWPFDQAECDHTDASASILGLEADGQKPGGGYAGQPSSGGCFSNNGVL